MNQIMCMERKENYFLSSDGIFGFWSDDGEKGIKNRVL